LERAVASSGASSRNARRALNIVAFSVRRLANTAVACALISAASREKRRRSRGAENQAMRKRYRVLLLATTVAAVIARVGFALSLETSPPAASSTSHIFSSTILIPPLLNTSAASPQAWFRWATAEPFKLLAVGGV